MVVEMLDMSQSCDEQRRIIGSVVATRDPHSSSVVCHYCGDFES